MEQKQINRRHLAHAGIILNNFAILGMTLLILASIIDVLQFLMILVIAIVVVVLVCILLLSLFTLWNWFNDLNVSTWFDPTGKFFEAAKQIVSSACPYVFGITCAFAIASIALLLHDGTNKHAGRIVVSALAVFFGIVAMLVNFL